ncbi:trimeric intracellular cation channel family protein [Flammeovirga kamogawensis]|uniref:Trimeric intracellular cation channel family protein n=1 Tax=Flammeovirga kamogawensis TaxID=373891 RepID=A0ABX8GSH3_9BACT|nr:trimeric intracellular cation channel family protein [Flammeovirga kamogawensis]MBB6463000.1 putative membrane protein YeiH [Flammeovirga kamogawensis]QWG06525.1 trimeric intracellular cation channel family protein [Flammeovirga kamogawensis]TRX68353.1 trimeric intracellular cation channel family protein [Flammeovirga kamogawensis]
MSLINFLDLVGTFVFAISGALAASEKKFDIFGAIFVASVTAVGGGTVRDMILGTTPVFWVMDTNYILVITMAVAFTVLFKETVARLRTTVFLFDTLGLGVFTFIGLEKSLFLDISPAIGIVMGTFTAVLGGVIRDTLCNEVPLIFRDEIYATACIIGGFVFVGLSYLNIDFNIITWTCISTVIAIRLLAIRYHIGLPKI